VSDRTDRARLPGTAVSAGLLQRWATTMADTGRVEPPVLASALGLDLRPGWLGYAEVADPPLGTSQVLLVVDEGTVRALTAELDGSQPVTRGELEAAFGAGAEQPTIHPADATIRAYEPILGARGRCRPTMELRDGKLEVARLTVGGG
jgi:hypothetical protein